MSAHGLPGLQDGIARATELARAPAERFARRVPERSGWSVAQHLEHLALAAIGSVAAARRILQGKGERGGTSRPMTRDLLAAGTIPRGVAQAPPAAVPSDRPDPAAVASLLEKVRSGAAALEGREKELEAATGTFDHPLLGPLGAREWVEFAAVHTAHHLAIVDDLLGAPDR